MGEVNNNIAITYEALYELLRREKNSEDIQQLDANFVDSVKRYMAEKRSMLYNAAEQHMLFSEEEQKKTLQQISNIIKILRELYDRREKKIISLAINMSKTNSTVIDTTKLLSDEKEMYYKVVHSLNYFRANILYNMIDEKRAADVIKNLKDALDPKEMIEKEKTLLQRSQEVNETEERRVSGKEQSDVKESVSEKPEPRDHSDMIEVKFIESVQKFIDAKLNVHGPFEPEDTATLPVAIADVLIKKGKAESV